MCKSMKSILIKIPGLLLLINWGLLINVQASDHKINISIIPDDSIVLENSLIQLQFNKNMSVAVFSLDGDKILSLNKEWNSGAEGLPPFYPVVNNKRYQSFSISFKNIKTEDIQSDFGSGRRLILKGLSSGAEQIMIEQTLTAELYNDFPTTVILYASFKNASGSQSVIIDTVYNCCFQLDASLIDPTQSAHSFYSFYGTAGRPVRQIEKILPGNFNINTYTGRPDSLEGIKQGNGGIPLIDLWCKKMGMAIGHIERGWQNVYFPIKIQNNGKVFIAVKEIPALREGKKVRLKYGESYPAIKTFVTVHHLDFYKPVKTYSELMRRQGIDMHTLKSPNDYLPAWCSWNDYSTHAMASKKDIMLVKPILERLEELREIGIKEIIFDAGWFDNQGDWRPNTDSLAFPAGDMDFISTVDYIQQQGFKVKLWISYLTADPWSQVAHQNPEWMIKKQDGTYHLDRWSGYTMCPALPEVLEYHRHLAQRFVADYGADGFKVDGMYVCPPCFNLLHNHTDEGLAGRTSLPRTPRPYPPPDRGRSPGRARSRCSASAAPRVRNRRRTST